MSVIFNSLSKNTKSSTESAPKNSLENRPVYEKALSEKASPLPVTALLVVGGVILISFGVWLLLNSLKADIRGQQATLNSKISSIEKKLDEADKKIEQLVSQDETNASGLKAGMLVIAETQKQLAGLSSAVVENKKTQDASIQEINKKLESVPPLPEKEKNAVRPTPSPSQAV